MSLFNVESIEPFVDEVQGVINTVIETPGGSQNKYDYDHVSGLFMLDRPIHSTLHYPFDYGFIPNTLAKDGDPVDVLLVIKQPTFPGCLIKSRVVGVMLMEDEAGGDEKIIAVAERDPRTAHIKDIADVPPHYQKEFEHFFIHIKDLEKEKWAKVECFKDRLQAIEIIRAGVANGRNK